MFLSYNRMVIGQPLQYYAPYERPLGPRESAFSYFQQFEPYVPSMESSEEYLMPCSPHSTQSDSDNSVSSIEVSSKPIQIQKPVIKKEENSRVQCCWKSCGVFFPSLDLLASHVSKCHSSSGPGGLFHCGWEGCTRNNKGFNARYKMLVHVRTHTNEKPHKCCQCEKSFSRAENLKIHSRSHSGEKPYVCPVPGCNKAYSNSSDRFKHTRTHSVEKPYPCKVPGCPKRYTDPSSLRKHVKTYKHFVNENSISETKKTPNQKNDHVLRNQDSMEDITKFSTETREKTLRMSPERIENRVSVITANNDSIARHNEDIFRLGALIDIKNDSYRFIESYEPKKLYRPYEIEPQTMEIDVELPLDLSIRRSI